MSEKVAPGNVSLSYLRASVLSALTKACFSLGNGPSGSAGLVWVLLAVDVITAFWLFLAPHVIEVLGRLWRRTGERRILFVIVLFAALEVNHLLTEEAVNAFYWSRWDPFFLQASRSLHYFLYFLVGVCAGMFATNQGPLANSDRRIGRFHQLRSTARNQRFVAVSYPFVD